MDKKNLPAITIVSLAYLTSNVDKEKLDLIIKYLFDSNITINQYIYILIIGGVFYISYLGAKEFLFFIKEIIDIRKEYRIKNIKKKLKKKYKEKN